MSSINESLEINCFFDYKQLKTLSEECLYSPLFFSAISNTTWRLQIDRHHPTKLGGYLILTDGAPCTLNSYTLSMTTYKSPPLLVFTNLCTQQRVFPFNDFSWGFENFCTRNEFKSDRNLICDPKTKLVHIRCTLKMDVLIPNNSVTDHRLATELFSKYSLQQWIHILKQNNDLPELSNRVNQEIESRLSS